ncbi:unnamed protein product [Mytilus edulis]|uniref:Reverse transcriptase domain-containing protein n=1 Tax=Mytilus edulis TaxID=6550 RepID=A0A8S3RTN5_MYTED|nr:unnamed protein product [Mytilus edulis]
MFDQARTLDLAQRSNEVYVQPYPLTAAIGHKTDESVSDSTTKLQSVTEEDKITAAAAQRPGSKQKCFFCGNNAHARRFCPAKDASCHNCVKYSAVDRVFIDKETTRLLTEGIIEPSMSPWRAQVLVTSNERHKKRLVIDYSQTINRYTELDAYPFPNINQMVSDIAKYKVYITLDLRSAYRQIPLREHEKKYTAFEANGSLYQFRLVPFGVTNGAACFQRIIDRLVTENNLEAVFVYIDNITIGGMDQNEHDENLRKTSADI